MTPALRAWVEALVDSRLQQVLPAAPGEDLSVSSWMARTCHQGAETSALTASALQQTEESTRRLQAEVKSLAEAQEQILRIVDSLTGDAERQSNSTQWVRIEQLSNIQRVISSVDELQKAMSQEGDGVLAQVRRSTVGLEELRRRQSEDSEKFRAELSDIKRLQSEAGHLQRNSGEELCAATGAVAELRREIQATHRAMQRADEAARLQEGQLRGGQQQLREQLDQLKGAQEASDHMSAQASRERQLLSHEKRLIHLEEGLEAARERHRSASDQYEVQVRSSKELLEQQQEAFERRQLYLEGQTRELINREVEDQLRNKKFAKMEQRLQAVEQLAEDSDARCSSLSRDFEHRLVKSEANFGAALGRLHGRGLLATQLELEKQFAEIQERLAKLEASVDGAVTAEELEDFAQQLGEQLAGAVRSSRGSQQSKLAQQVKEEVALRFQRLVEGWDGTFCEQVGSFERQLLQHLKPQTRALVEQQDADATDTASVAATEVPPEAAVRMSRELDVFVGLSSSDAAKLFVQRARARMRA